MNRDSRARLQIADKLWAKALSLAIGVVLAVALVAAAEWIARAALPQGDLERILRALQPDAVLFWRNRANVDEVFFGKPIVTNNLGIRRASRADRDIGPKRAGSVRVLCLGASPTFGWGVDYSLTYAQRLEQSLRRDLHIDADVINAGMIGFSSHQGRLLLERELLALQPDLVTIAYVVNDVDKYRFFRTNGEPDRTLAPQGALQTWLTDIATRSRLLQALTAARQTAVAGSASFHGKPVELLRPRAARVPLGDYRANLEALVALARSRGARVLLLAMPVHLPTGTAVAPEAANEARRLLAAVSPSVGSAQGCASALPTLRQVVALDPDLSEAHHLLGVCHRAAGDDAQAQAAFRAAMVAESHRCGRDGLAYNRVLREVGARLNVPVADAASRLSPPQDEGMFLTAQHDPIHPSAAGHAVIAELLLAAVRDHGLAVPRDR